MNMLFSSIINEKKFQYYKLYGSSWQAESGDRLANPATKILRVNAMNPRMLQDSGTEVGFRRARFSGFGGMGRVARCCSHKPLSCTLFSSCKLAVPTVQRWRVSAGTNHKLTAKSSSMLLYCDSAVIERVVSVATVECGCLSNIVFSTVSSFFLTTI